MSELLDEVTAVIAAEPQSAAALTLFALVSTLEFERAGCLFKLVKLRDLNAAQRQLAYRLIEMMSERYCSGPEWSDAKARMDALVRAG